MTRFSFEFDDSAWGVPIFYDNTKKLSFDEVEGLLNVQQAIIEQLKSVLRKECNIITDEDLLEYVKTNGVSLNE